MTARAKCTLRRVPSVLAVVCWFACTAFAQGTIDPAAERELLGLVNQARAEHGLAALATDERLVLAARKHTALMIERDELSHQFSGEDPLILRLKAEKVRSDHDGENIALNGDVKSAHVALMGSPLHRANILNAQFNSVGIAVLRVDDLLYVTEDFAHLLPDYSEFEADAAVQQAITDFTRSKGLPVPKRLARPQLVRMACDMAGEDKIDPKPARSIPGSTTAVGWTATVLQNLPPGLKSILSQPMSGPYSLGVCFATSATYPGGVYWALFVTY